MGTEISLGLVWVDSNNEWQIPEDWDPHLFDLSVSENLNEVAKYWNERNDLERICTELVLPPEFLTTPQFDTTYLDFFLDNASAAVETENDGSHPARTIEFLPNEWIQLGHSLRSLAYNPDVIAVPHGMTPWDWYALSEDEKLSQMGLSESKSLRSDGVIYSDFNSFYFDTYRFGWFGFELIEDLQLERIYTDLRFVAYAREIVERGPDSEFHSACNDTCSFRQCSRIVYFPASISLW